MKTNSPGLKTVAGRGAGLAWIIAAMAGCDKPASTSPQPPGPAVSAVAPVTPTAGPAIPSLARATTQPGVIRPGDWLRLRVPELVGAGVTTELYGRVTADGNVSFPLVGLIQVGGSTVPVAEDAAAAAYQTAKIISSPHVSIERVYLAQPGDRPPGPIAIGDLVRLEVWELTGAGIQSTVIHRIATDGTISAPVVGRVKIGGLSNEAASRTVADKYREQRVINNAIVTVTTLEQAPPDADHLDLPDEPVYPVPEPLKAMFKQ